MTNKLSRRAFLTAAGGALAGLALPQPLKRALADTNPPSPEELDFIEPDPVYPELWGRTTVTTTVREFTGLNQPVVEFLHPNVVLPLLEELHAEGNNPNNDLWYRVSNGFIYTPTIQPMKPYRMPTELTEVDEEFGAWAEVIVPYSLARTEPSGPPVRLEDESQVFCYYASVHRILAVEPDLDGNLWYKVYDDKEDAEPMYILARHMRPLTPADFEPINPGANKKVVVNLVDQRIDCFEDDLLVFSTLTSSGGEGFATPSGDHAVVYKQPSRHMYSDPEVEAFSDPNFFDLPGVPFNIFFTTLGHAIHGTYWHGDFGRPRSHGCLNVTPEAAHWLYRWVEPFAPYDVEAVGSSSDPGTPITVL